MAQKGRRIEGFEERVLQVVYESDLTQIELARRMGYSRQSLYPSSFVSGWGAMKVARFCAVTCTDANWLLGLSRERKKDE